ncbi:hypothetical protein B0J18DRAFT_482727 [Chaetomium sp. MPI-SDFR-AT-0129]|nr:hypothetical protein B0J18DRAFT_482727 [Chaetomium sp. MPI-SDFR-AT-0129]
MTDPHPHLTSLRRDGYVILRSLLTPPEITSLRAAAADLTTTARAGGWPHVRTVGKQFPPWDASLVPSQAGIWGVQHLLHPDLPVSDNAGGGRGAFARVYFHPKLLRVARELLSIPPPEADGEDDGAMTMELFNMLVQPLGVGVDPTTPFALRWHRDDIPWTATPEEELAHLQPPSSPDSWPPYTHTQYNLPLYPDTSLIIIPASHTRARTEIERAADPYEANLPGQITVSLEPGDVVFYDNNILHRGVYDVSRERMTLHGSVGHVDGQKGRARNVLQHGVGGWVGRCDFGVLGEEGKGGQRGVAEGMRRRLVELGRENEGRDVGFSLEG